MSSFCVIGSGISGATIANLLSKKHSIDLYDKAKKVSRREKKLEIMKQIKILSKNVGSYIVKPLD